ncbi:MAG: terpene cyclase/mutase family protein, partial [Thermoguttaceae bacterium]|nr:terpene cyclase/mutase family protein [Thermoguttaceae bacterium]
DNQVAATGLALLAFQGNGNTRFQGEYKAEVKKGVSWLLRQQQEDGCFIPSQVSTGSHFYTHAICTICLGELVVMEKSKGEDLRPVVRKAVDYLLKYQSPKGGWRYIPGDGESDLSVTGWCLMALQTAKMAGIRVPDEALQKISDFVDSVSYNDGSEYAYRYTDGGLTNKRISMTATGLLCREYLGWEQDNPALLRGAELVTKPENLIRFPDPATKASRGTFSQNVYGWYSASMMLKHLGPYNKYWRSWNKVMSQELPAHQEPDQSQEAGSWNPDYDEYRISGGRLYVTCLSIFCLEVYYRHLSLYR